MIISDCPPMAQNARRAEMTRPDFRRYWRMAAIAVLVAGAILILLTGWHRHLSIETLVAHRAMLDRLVTRHYEMALLAFMALYVAVVALSIPGALFLTVAGGILFGGLAGGLAAIAGATLGATLVFILARWACGEALTRRAGPRLAKIAAGVRADAFSYLLFLRLVPAFPFWLVNLAPALLGVKLRTFVGATLLGVIPGTIAFAMVGAGLDSVLRAQGAVYRRCLAVGRTDCRLNFDISAVLTPQVILALVALGVLALIPIAIRRWRASAGVLGPAD